MSITQSARQFATKIELGWRMIQRVKANGLPFEAVACDDLYGRSGWLCRQLGEAGIIYMADVPEDTQVYLTRPDFGVPLPRPGQRGPHPTRPQVLNEVKPIEVRQVVERSDTPFQRVRVRSTERGELNVLATWFVAQTKHEWAQLYPRDPELAQQMELEALALVQLVAV